MAECTDKELLELAAKAAGLRIKYWAADNYPVTLDEEQRQCGWNPLVYASDALRLAVCLGLVVDCSRPSAGLPFNLHEICVNSAESNMARTCRAIVRAAAKIGGAMP